MRFYGLFKVANQKVRKAIDNVCVILNKIHFIFVYGKFTASCPLIYSHHLTIYLGLVIMKNKLTSVFYASVLSLMINFVITLSKFTAEPLVCGLWFHSHFDNVMIQFIINKRTDA